MPCFRASWGSLGAGIGAALTFVAWLFWPSPSLDIDWHRHAQEFASRGECFEASGALELFAIYPDEAERAARQMSALGQCEDEMNRFLAFQETEFAQGYVDYFGDEQRYSRQSEWQRTVRAWGSYSMAVQYRDRAGLAQSHFLDAVTFIRCQRQFDSERRELALFLRGMLAWVGSGLAVPFDNLRNHCYRHIANEYARLQAMGGVARNSGNPLDQLTLLYFWAHRVVGNGDSYNQVFNRMQGHHVTPWPRLSYLGLPIDSIP